MTTTQPTQSVDSALEASIARLSREEIGNRLGALGANNREVQALIVETKGKLRAVNEERGKLGVLRAVDPDAAASEDSRIDAEKSQLQADLAALEGRLTANAAVLPVFERELALRDGMVLRATKALLSTRFPVPFHRAAENHAGLPGKHTTDEAKAAQKAMADLLIAQALQDGSFTNPQIDVAYPAITDVYRLAEETLARAWAQAQREANEKVEKARTSGA